MRVRRLGIVADTHGEMRSDALSTLRSAGVDLILHAGDIGSEEVLAALEQVAPVIAVAGNGDQALYHRYPWDMRLWLGQRRVFLCHWYDNYGRVHPGYERTISEWAPDVLVYGHTHQALLQQRGPTLFFNPGYAGPPQPSRTRSVGTLDLTTLDARILYL